jgi:SAM-dependent methyltransferase
VPVEELPSEILEHYRDQDEGSRLTRSAHGRLEFLRTQELLRRHLPAPPASVLDVGGGTGVHATWLSGDGYQVELVDPVPEHVARANESGAFSASVGDARALDGATDSVDAVLLLGPLYHLVERDQRLRALREARRVARTGGVVAAAGISRYMALLDWSAAGQLDRSVVSRLLPVLQTGVHDSTLGFTTAFFHLPSELVDEMQDAGFVDVRIFGIEGPAWMAADAAPPAEMDRFLESALRCAQLVEVDPLMLPVSGHLLAVGAVP